MPHSRTAASPAPAVMLYDGVCRLCNGGVNFIIDRDPKGRFRFASQQSDAGRELMRRHGLPAAALNTIFVIDDGHCFARSSAILQIVRLLGGKFRLLALLGAALPTFFRDLLYDWVAANRYRWFGRFEACRMPDPERVSRFLD